MQKQKKNRITRRAVGQAQRRLDRLVLRNARPRRIDRAKNALAAREATAYRRAEREALTGV